MNRCCCCRDQQSPVVWLLIGAGVVAFALPVRAYAQFAGKASATGRFESNSNVFDLESTMAEPVAAGFRRSDTYYAYGAAFDGDYLLGRQQFYATAGATEYRYQYFTSLDHNDYNVDLGLKWQLGDALDGKLNATRTRNMVPFIDLAGSVLSLTIATEQKEAAIIGLRIASDWRVEGSGYTSRTDQPIPGAPNLRLTVNSGTTSLEYLGITGLTSGLTVSYLSGRYDDANGTDNPSYDQSTAGLLADYKLGRQTLEAQAGYSRRTSNNALDDASGFTGELAFKHRLTPKSTVTINIERAINNYLPNLGSEIDTGAGASVSWQATYNLGVSVGYTFTYRNYPSQAGEPAGSNRVDYQQNPTLQIDFRPQRWLLIRPYANALTRNSNVREGDFNSTIFGVSVTVLTFDAPKGP